LCDVHHTGPRADGIPPHQGSLAVSRAVGVEVAQAPIMWLSPARLTGECPRAAGASRRNRDGLR